MTSLIEDIQPYAEVIQAWRNQQEADLRAEDGWLSVVGLFWLHEGENSVGSNPDCEVVLPLRLPAHLGTLIFSPQGVVLQVADGAGPVRVGGQLVRESVLSDDPLHPTLVQVEQVTFFVIRRGDRVGVRMRDAASEARRNFTGRAWFPLDPAFRVAGRFEPHPSQRTIEVETAIGTAVAFNNPGAVTFELNGLQQRLEAFEGEDGELWFLFRDSTSGRETYGAGRELYALLGADGVVDMDFNKAQNLPCVFTPFATCPMAPKANHLPLAVQAGERLPG